MIFSLIDKIQASTKSSFYLPFFRLFICFHLTKRLLFYWSSLETIYGSKSFVAIGTNEFTQAINQNLISITDHYEILIYIYIILILLYAFGVGKHITALCLFIVFVIFQKMNPYILNGGDNLMYFIMLYMIFTDSYQKFVIKPLQLNESTQKTSNLFTYLGVSCICIHLCVVYFFSAIGKLNSEEWYNGVAVYYIFQLERFMGTFYNISLAKNGYFITIVTYFTLLFEISFPFLIWIKRMRLTLILCGISMHLGIYIFMMIHDFQFIFIMLYPFFFTNKELIQASDKIKKIFQSLFTPRIKFIDH